MRWVRGDHGSPLTYVVQARGTLKRVRRGRPAQEIRVVAQRIAELSEALRAFLKIDSEKDVDDWLEETE